MHRTKLQLTLALMLVGFRLNAATIFALSPSQVDVSNAVASASSGDVVSIPAGTNSWTQGISLSKNITIQGAGSSLTVLVDELVGPDGDPKSSFFNWTTSTNDKPRITGIGFERGTASGSFSFGSIWFRGSSLSARVDNCRFYNLRNNGVYWGDRVCGVMDHCSYSTTGSPHASEVHHYDWQPWTGAQAYGDGSWSTPFGWGTTNMVVIESCDFTKSGAAIGTAAIDTFDGARFCVRYCTFTNCFIEMHGTDSSGRLRGARAGEVYMNTAYYTTFWTGFLDMRSGSAVFWSNNILGNISIGVNMNIYRLWADITPYHAANRTNSWDVSSNWVFYAGTHKGAAVSGHFIDTNANWSTNQWKGYVILNTNQAGHVAQSMITGNTATDATFVLAANSGGFTASQPITATNAGNVGVNLIFNNGDGAEFHFVRFALDAPGSGTGDALINGSSTVNPTPTTWPNQAREPVYSWGNTGTGANTINSGYYVTALQSGSEYNQNTQKPGYTALVFPHPLVGTNTPPPPPPSNLGVYSINGKVIKL